MLLRDDKGRKKAGTLRETSPQHSFQEKKISTNLQGMHSIEITSQKTPAVMNLGGNVDKKKKQNKTKTNTIQKHMLKELSQHQQQGGRAI